jgi:hypothetical protein
MTRGLCALAAAVLLPIPTAAQSGMEALEKLGASLRGAAAWRTEYSQEYVAAGMSSGDRVEGEVTVAWPDRARFVSGRPTVQEMGLEGRVVRLVDIEVGSCDEHNLDDEEWARVPLAAVLDPASAVDRFTVLDHGEKGFVLVPREPGGVDRVSVVLGEDGLPVEVVIADPQGAVNRLRFGRWIKAEGPPGPDGWLPEPPPGIECVND